MPNSLSHSISRTYNSVAHSFDYSFKRLILNIRKFFTSTLTHLLTYIHLFNSEIVKSLANHEYKSWCFKTWIIFAKITQTSVKKMPYSNGIHKPSVPKFFHLSFKLPSIQNNFHSTTHTKFLTIIFQLKGCKADGGRQNNKPTKSESDLLRRVPYFILFNIFEISNSFLF